jgi:ribosome-binding factor A
MSNRTLRINELIQREISAYLHTRYQGEAVRITITSVAVSPDLHEGRVFYSVLGGRPAEEECGRWLEEKSGEIRHIVGRAVVLKQVPKLAFKLDTSAERGTRVVQLLDELQAGAPPASRIQPGATPLT